MKLSVNTDDTCSATRGGRRKDAVVLRQHETEEPAFRQEDRRKKCGITMTLSTCSPLGSNRAQVDAMNIDSALRFKILFKELKQK